MEKDGIEVDLTAKRRLNSHRMSIKAQQKPSIKLGFAVTAFFSFLERLICIFFLLTLVAVPQMWILSTGSGYDLESSQSYEIYSIGNLGQSTASCSTVSLDAIGIFPYCAYGTLTTLNAYGINT
jgi:hypothetical protein